MKRIILITLLIFTINCKEAAEEAGFIEADTMPITEIDLTDDIDLFIDGQLTVPTQAMIDHEYLPEEVPELLAVAPYRQPHYYECKMLKNWVPGRNVNYSFSGVENGSFQLVRFDRDGILLADGRRAPPRVFLGSCTVEVDPNTHEVLYLEWRGVNYIEIILDVL